MPSWVTDETLKLRSERDKAKKRYLLIRTRHAKETWRRLNTTLNESYRADELAALDRQMEDLRVADEKGNYSTTWKIIHNISGKNKTSNPKVKKRDGTAPSSDKELLDEWKEYFSALLNVNNGTQTPDLPPPADQDLDICEDPPTLEETRKAIQGTKTTKPLDWIVLLRWKHSKVVAKSWWTSSTNSLWRSSQGLHPLNSGSPM